MFLILVAVGQGFALPRQPVRNIIWWAGFSSKACRLVGSDNVAAFIIHEDGARHEVTELRLRKGIVLSEEVREYATLPTRCLVRKLS